MKKVNSFVQITRLLKQTGKKKRARGHTENLLSPMLEYKIIIKRKDCENYVLLEMWK